MRIIALAAAARRFGRFQLTPLLHRWSFSDNEPIDDISEKFFTYSTNPTTYVPYGAVSNNKLNPTNSEYGTSLAIDYAPMQNEPFSIQCKFRLNNYPVNYQAGVITSWHETDATQRSWGVFVWSDGSVKFLMSSDGTDTDILTVSSAVGMVVPNKDYHVAVERDHNNTIAIYLNGALVASAVDGRKAFQKPSIGIRVRRGVVGSVWDIQLDKRVVFGSPFVNNVPSKFSLPTSGEIERYTDEVAADIVYQMSGRRSSTVNEVNGSPLALNKSNMYNGKLFVSNDVAASYSAPIDYFGAGDFTMECKYVLESAITGTGVFLMSNWHNGANNHTDNRWNIINLPNGSLQVIFANSMNGGDYVIRATPAGVIVQGRRHHIVIERYNGVIKVFVDGIERLSWSQPTPLWATTNNKIRNIFSGTGYGQHRIWDIRIAKRAMYKHVSPKWDESLPKMPTDWRTSKPTHRLTVGSNDVANGTVVYRGFAKHFLYGASTVSFGELPHELYYNTDTGKVMRIVALFYQTNGYIVMALRESSRPFVQGMPTMTNKIKIAGGPTVDFALGTQLSASTDPGVIAKHFNVNNVANWNTAFATDETEVSFSFV